MDFVWSTAAKDLRRLGRDRAAIATWIGIPFAIGTLVSLAFGGADGPAPTAHLLVVDEQDDFLSGFLVGALSQDAAGGLIEAEEVELEAGMKRIGKGEATALLVIPDGFTDAILSEEPAKLRLYTNPSQTILPGIVEEGLSIFVDASFYLSRLIGEDLQQFVEGPESGSSFPDQQIADFSVKVNRIVEQLVDYLDPLVIEVETPAPTEDGEEETNLALLFLPGLLFMSLLFLSQGVADDLWQEREHGTLRRVVVSPRSVIGFLLGKVAAAAGLTALVSGITLTAAYAVYSLDWVLWPLAIVWTVFSAAVLTTLMMVIQLHSSSHRAGNLLTMLLVFPLMMIGGSFFPFEAMPEWLAGVGRMTPNGWALEQLKTILFARVEPAALGVAFVALMGTGALLFSWSAARLRSRFASA